MARQVNLQPGAYTDTREIARFIAHRVSPASAAHWHARISAAIGRLATNADQWPEADEAVAHGIDLRVMLNGKRPHVYRVLFTLDDQTVNVLRVRHAAQDQLTSDDI